ncbi:MAG: hypothetical protein L0287_18875 [Anaerolineae bacterium]|nr:hypothetical protein [Anaerolineae bacterium]MCI0608262.1 hypothetical protein [Anaerolineae bacterium]
MNVLSDGSSILLDHWRLIYHLLLILLFGQILIGSALKKIFGERLTADEYFSLGLAGWMIPALMLSMLWFLWGPVQSLHFDVLIATVTIALFAFWLFPRSKKEVVNESKIILLFLTLLFGIFIFLRLAFVSQAILPSYFDSAQHYMIIKDLMGNAETANAAASFDLLITNYYHKGFHLLALFITSITQAEVTDTMLILGQILLAVIPLSVFFIIKHETKSNGAGLFAVLLSAFGWYMPAHVLDWGKYPALASLALIQFVFSVAYLLVKHGEGIPAQKQWALYVTLTAGFLAACFAHSRSLVIFGIIFLAWITAKWWQRLPQVPQYIALSVVIVGIILEIIFIQTHEVLYLLFDPYGLTSWLVTLSVLFLLGFALRTYPQLTFSAVVAIFLLIASLFVPVTIPGYVNLTLLDRPFVEMILYLPLSLIGGLGLAGLEGYLLHSQIKLKAYQTVLGNYVGVLLIGLVVINALTQYELYPSDCCQIVGSDDLVAMDWMDKNLPSEARVLISAVELRVLASDSFEGYVGGDAGIWIRPLTNRTTIPLPDHSDFNQQTILNNLCDMKVGYLYVGETGQTFDDSQISIHPEWYKILLSMPKAKVYQVIGCD